MSQISPEQVAAIDATLNAHSSALAELQDGLAATVDGAIAQTGKAAMSIKRVLNGKMNAVQQHQISLTSAIVGQLGDTIGGQLQPMADQVKTLATVAVNGAMPTPIPPAPSPVLPPPSMPTSGGGNIPLPTGPAVVATVYTVTVQCAADGSLIFAYHDQNGVWSQWNYLDGRGATSPTGFLVVNIPVGQADSQALLAAPTAWVSSWLVAHGYSLTGVCGSGGPPPPPPPPPPTLPGGGGGGIPVTAGQWALCVLQNVGAGGGFCPALEWRAPGAPLTFCAVVATYTPTGDATQDAINMDTIRLQWMTEHEPQCLEGPPAPPPLPPTLPGGGGGQPPSCPPCTYTPPPPPPTCNLRIPDLSGCLLPGGRLPQVGSVEWCRCLDALTSWVASIGELFSAQLQAVVGTDQNDGPLAAFLTASNQVLGPLSPFFTVEQIKALVTTAGSDVQCAYTTLSHFVTSMAGVVGPQLIGLTFARTLLRIIHNLRIGWDAAVWLTIDVEISLRPIEELLDYLEHYAFQWEIPSIGEAMECILYQSAPLEQAYCWMRCHGANTDIYDPVLRARREKLSVEETIQYLRRNNATTQQQVDALRPLGWTNPYEASARVVLYDELPSVQDHLHWLQRGVFDDQYVIDYGLAEGFEERFWAKFGDQLYAQGYTKDRAYLEYAAHWINPSIGQLAEMMQRLRPGRVDPSIQFTTTDFERILVEQDVAPYFRKRLESISYRTLPLRQLNQATQQGAFDLNELTARYQDIGFTETDAKTLAQSAIYTAAKQVASALHGYTAAFVSELSQYQLITQADANEQLSKQGYTEEQVATLFNAAQLRKRLAERKKHDEGAINSYATLALSMYEEGAVAAADVLNALTSSGYSIDAATLSIQTVDLRVRKSTIDGAIKAIRSAYRFGAVGPADVVSALLTAGVVPVMAATYAARWQLEMSVPRVAASAGMILRWAKKGIISVQNARQRLSNLGWLASDADLALAEVEQAILQAQALAAQRRAKDLAKAQKLAQAAIKAAQKESCKVYTPGKMMRWYKLRIIDEAEFKRRLNQCGYTPEEIDGLFREAVVARAAADKKAEKSGAAGVEYTGPGHDASPGPNGAS